ncbi:MAG: hypothetical protein IT310_13620, partial [Anaerolineales bacterium]|nr:hypothetical protein [Anaerolineales bacterium]
MSETKPNQTKPNQTKPNQTKPNHKRFIRIIAVCLVVIVLYLLPVNTKPEFIAYR